MAEIAPKAPLSPAQEEYKRLKKRENSHDTAVFHIFGVCSLLCIPIATVSFIMLDYNHWFRWMVIPIIILSPFIMCVPLHPSFKLFLIVITWLYMIAVRASVIHFIYTIYNDCGNMGFGSSLDSCPGFLRRRNGSIAALVLSQIYSILVFTCVILQGMNETGRRKMHEIKGAEAKKGFIAETKNPVMDVIDFYRGESTIDIPPPSYSADFAPPQNQV